MNLLIACWNWETKMHWPCLVFASVQPVAESHLLCKVRELGEVWLPLVGIERCQLYTIQFSRAVGPNHKVTIAKQRDLYIFRKIGHDLRALRTSADSSVRKKWRPCVSVIFLSNVSFFRSGDDQANLRWIPAESSGHSSSQPKTEGSTVAAMHTYTQGTDHAGAKSWSWPVEQSIFAQKARRGSCYLLSSW